MLPPTPADDVIGARAAPGDAARAMVRAARASALLVLAACGASADTLSDIDAVTLLGRIRATEADFWARWTGASWPLRHVLTDVLAVQWPGTAAPPARRVSDDPWRDDSVDADRWRDGEAA